MSRFTPCSVHVFPSPTLSSVLTWVGLRFLYPPADWASLLDKEGLQQCWCGSGSGAGTGFRGRAGCV